MRGNHPQKASIWPRLSCCVVRCTTFGRRPLNGNVFFYFPFSWLRLVSIHSSSRKWRPHAKGIASQPPCKATTSSCGRHIPATADVVLTSRINRDFQTEWGLSARQPRRKKSWWLCAFRIIVYALWLDWKLGRRIIWFRWLRWRRWNQGPISECERVLIGKAILQYCLSRLAGNVIGNL